ncbi:pyrophosphatase PpaX [Sporosarcina luteola]|nr:pyrophosphatase PpaX [Sporosarcina luteola]
MAKPIQALLFDFDGTLLDTNELIIQTFQTVLDRHYPGKYLREHIVPFLGPTLVESFGTVDPLKVEQLVIEYREWNLEHHDELATEFEGVADTLHKLRAQGMKMAIVSTKRNNMIQKGLRLLGVEDVFETIVGLDDVQKPKPDPEPILLALQRLGVAPDEAMMIGDNYHDIEGGKNAGVRTAGVAWSLKGEAFLQTFHPDYMLHHISDILAIVNGEEQ